MPLSASKTIARSPITFDADLGLNAYKSAGSVSTEDLSRLGLDGRTRTGEPVFRTGEGLSAGEFEQSFGVRLDRVPSANWLGKNPPDFAITGGLWMGRQWTFFILPTAPIAVEKMNENIFRNSKVAKNVENNLLKHLGKADIVPLDFRILNYENQQKLLVIIKNLTPGQRAKLLIIR